MKQQKQEQRYESTPRGGWIGVQANLVPNDVEYKT